MVFGQGSLLELILDPATSRLLVASVQDISHISHLIIPLFALEDSNACRYYDVENREANIAKEGVPIEFDTTKKKIRTLYLVL